MTELAPRERALTVLRKHGYNATSFQVLEEGFRYWFDGDEACVAYADTGGAWVVAGAPIAAEERLIEVARRFEAAAREARRRVCYFAVEDRFVAACGGASLAIGAQAVWDPRTWDATLRAVASLREQLRRARARGVRVRAATEVEVTAAESPTRTAMAALIDRWLASRPMAPMGFLVDVQPFSFAGERRYFLAEESGRLVGFLVAVPVYARGGWLFEDLLRDPAAPNGTTELLFDTAMRDAASAGCGYVTLGLAPLSGTIDPRLRLARDLSSSLYDFTGLHRFKSKLRPARWDPIHLLCAPRTPVALALVDTLTAFARGSLSRYGIRSVLRGPAIVVRVLALALIPWTALLLLADTARWFPSLASKVAWIAFHAAVGVGLWVLSVRWRDGLSAALAVGITLDAVVTLVLAVTFNLAHVRGVGDAVFVLLSTLAPLLASAILWSARSLR